MAFFQPETLKLPADVTTEMELYEYNLNTSPRRLLAWARNEQPRQPLPEREYCEDKAQLEDQAAARRDLVGVIAKQRQIIGEQHQMIFGVETADLVRLLKAAKKLRTSKKQRKGTFWWDTGFDGVFSGVTIEFRYNRAVAYVYQIDDDAMLIRVYVPFSITAYAEGKFSVHLPDVATLVGTSKYPGLFDLAGSTILAGGFNPVTHKLIVRDGRNRTALQSMNTAKPYRTQPAPLTDFLGYGERAS